MNIAVIGATGMAGSRVVSELLARGHRVTGMARHPETLAKHPALTLRPGDAREPEKLSALLAGHDAVVSAARFLQVEGSLLIAAAKQAKVPRFLVVGGAGTLLTASGQELVDTPAVPPSSKDEALAGRAFLNLLRAEPELDWTYLSPSGMFAPGARTGKFRLGLDRLLIAADGKAGISAEDFAIALADEIERPRHSRRRFTVGY